MNRPSYEYMAEMYDERIKRLKADYLAVVAEKEQEYKSLLEHHETQTKDFKEQIATLTNKFRSLENDYVQQGAIYEGISDILRDGNTSDFMLSFEIVRQVSDLRERACCLPCNSWGHTDSCIRNNVAALKQTEPGGYRSISDGDVNRVVSNLEHALEVQREQTEPRGDIE